MASPIGHSLAGIVCALAGSPRSGGFWRWICFGIFAGIAADLDFIPGLLVGDVNKYHHGLSHSITAALIFGLMASYLSRWLQASAFRIGLVGMLGYGSHLLLDYLTYDGRAPYGIPLFWPLDDHYWSSPYPIFVGIKHGVPGDALTESVIQGLSWHNLYAIGVELALVPVVLLVWYLRYFKKPRLR
ncbi:metal-dependent hydrolase [Nitrosococcus wardiae]|uniref:metal-dependent hydrolase n=1 Tax=Nitrosococcus wardiae TaxID=1814290 RepID=UPI00141B2986|nr:metal-dependent hydrolase [Nitrosococcus wardiae]